MTVSAITGVTLEGNPKGLSSFIRNGVVYVLWYYPVGLGYWRLSWKPHDGADFTEISPQVNYPFFEVSALYVPSIDSLLVAWASADSEDGVSDGRLFLARFRPQTGALDGGITELCAGTAPRLMARTEPPSSALLLYYRTPKNLGVYCRTSANSGYSWSSAYPLYTGQVAQTTSLTAVLSGTSHASVAQLGNEARGLKEVGLWSRTRPLASIVQHPVSPATFFVGEPSRRDSTSLVDTLRGALVLATNGSRLYHLDGASAGSADGVNAVVQLTVSGGAVMPVASAGPVAGGNGDDLVEYSLVPALGTLNVELPTTVPCAVSLAVTGNYAYVALYSDATTTDGTLTVVNLSTGTSASPLSGITAVRAVATLPALSLIFVATTEAGFERLRVYQENALTPTLLLNTKLTTRANALTVTADPENPTGALIYASLMDRLNVYQYISASVPVQLRHSMTLPSGATFFQARVLSTGTIVVAAGAGGVGVFDPNGRCLAQTLVSGKLVSEWKALTAYTAGTLVRPREAHQFSQSRYYFRVTSSGSSGPAEPYWSATGTVQDETVQWQAVGLLDGVAVGVVVDETNKLIYAVGNAGGVAGTDGRVWTISAAMVL